MVPDKLLRLKVAEMEGWTGIVDTGDGLVGVSPDLPDERLVPVPNWPASLDTARELLAEEGQELRFVQCLYRILRDSGVIPGDVVPYDAVVYLIDATAQQWCLTWLLSEHGLRWVECGNVLYKLSPQYRNSQHPIGDINPCPTCKGDKGEWERS